MVPMVLLLSIISLIFAFILTLALNRPLPRPLPRPRGIPKTMQSDFFVVINSDSIIFASKHKSHKSYEFLMTWKIPNDSRHCRNHWKEHLTFGVTFGMSKLCRINQSLKTSNEKQQHEITKPCIYILAKS